MLAGITFVFPLANAASLLGGPGPRPLGWLLLGVSLAHCVHNIGLGTRCLDHYLWKRPAPWWRLFFSGVLFATVATVLVVKVAVDGMAHLTTMGMVLQASGLMFFGPCSLLTRIRKYLAVTAATALGLGVLVVLPTGEWSGGVTVAVFLMGIGLWSMATLRTSGWILSVLWELEAARGVQARLAVAEERLRFGRDMHDVLGRNLAVIALKSELAGQLARRGSEAALEQMDEVQRLARESQREMRELVRGYRQADLHTELVGARGVLAAAGIECRIDDRSGRELPVPVQSVLAWVVREGTTNVLRHADARRCAIRLRAADGEAVLTMENDGVQDAGPGSGAGSGLAGLRERVTVLGGTLTAERRARRTFRLAARVPLTAAPEAGKGVEAPSPEQEPEREPEQEEEQRATGTVPAAAGSVGAGEGKA
ncbi:sensor histidine kinase [Streptomyces gamaensis]|uniref:Sensor histidine kinase n=1 Tax=Streptomyces gamaensis TaxID=1763542 RepID=A0ABW0YVT4_9ACTN